VVAAAALEEEAREGTHAPGSVVAESECQEDAPSVPMREVALLTHTTHKLKHAHTCTPTHTHTHTHTHTYTNHTHTHLLELRRNFSGGGKQFSRERR
jgi:hypothetical protein